MVNTYQVVKTTFLGPTCKYEGRGKCVQMGLNSINSNFLKNFNFEPKIVLCNRQLHSPILPGQSWNKQKEAEKRRKHTKASSLLQSKLFGLFQFMCSSRETRCLYRCEISPRLDRRCHREIQWLEKSHYWIIRLLKNKIWSMEFVVFINLRSI